MSSCTETTSLSEESSVKHPIQYGNLMGRYVEAACTRLDGCFDSEHIEPCREKIMNKVCRISDCTKIVDYDIEGQQWSQCLRELSEMPCDGLVTPAVCNLP